MNKILNGRAYENKGTYDPVTGIQTGVIVVRFLQPLLDSDYEVRITPDDEKVTWKEIDRGTQGFIIEAQRINTIKSLTCIVPELSLWINWEIWQ